MRHVPGYEGLYAVNEHGDVFSLRKGEPSKMSPSRDKDGYLQVVFSDREAKRHRFYVHRLVTITFLPNPCDLPQVNHKDGDKRNNSLSNLEWCSNSQNAAHCHRTGLHGADKLTFEDATAIRGEYRKGVRGRGMRALAKKYGVSVAHVCHIIEGKKWKEVS